MFRTYCFYFRLAFMLMLGLVGIHRAAALTPHELLLVVNQNSPHSLELANRYIQLRGLPPENILYLALPESVLAPAAEISPDDFTRHIWQPLEQALRERGLTRRILAVAYSADFPVRVTTAPPTSLTGLTFVRNEIPPSGLITTGSFQSVFFTGPTRPAGPMAGSRSLGWFQDAAPQRLLPLPAMLLGHAGARGLEVDEIFQTLKKTTAPLSQPWNGVVVFQTNDDIRSHMRAWQFAQAQTELATLGVPALITNTPPPPATPVFGWMCGTAWPAPPPLAFAPGAYADHCTSFGARFHSADQAKLTLWLRAGAALTAGTVSEPYSVWTKFPNARFFAHQVRGCSAVECFALSVRCPLQLLAVGDPLAAPFAPPLTARMAIKAEHRGLAVLVQPDGAPTGTVMRYSFFLNGRCIERDSPRPGVLFDTAKLSDGAYHIMAVATMGDAVRFSAQADGGFMLNRQHRVPLLDGLKPSDRLAGDTPLRVKIVAPAEAREVGLFQGERMLVRGTAHDITLEPARLGSGPVELQAVAWYADGAMIRGTPVAVEITRPVPPPEPPGFHILNIFAAEGTTCSTTNAYAIWTVATAKPQALAVALTPSTGSLTLAARAGLVFNVRDEQNFDFFGLVGETCGWTLATVRDGNFSVLAARGRPVQPGITYRLGVRTGDYGVEGLVNQEVLLCSDKIKLETEPVGIGVSGAGATFSKPAVLPQKEKL